MVEIDSNQKLEELILLLNEHIADGDYNIVSYPINEVLYKSYQNELVHTEQ